jgi:hypothetical protein
MIAHVHKDFLGIQSLVQKQEWGAAAASGGDGF